MNFFPEKQITMREAKKIAENAAKEQLQSYANSKISFLSDEFMEADYCWFFFRNKKIIGPPEEVLNWDWAYAVSKKGELSLIADYSKDTEALKDYLKKMSNYFRDRGL